jgi:SAM-dependent methyltransferase
VGIGSRPPPGDEVTMRGEAVHPLDPETLELFASKGQRPGIVDARAGNANAVKVRRILQILRDLGTPVEDRLRILDLACGEGVYSIEAALRGAEVLALDARTDRMGHGARASERLGLTNVRFEQGDVRGVTTATHGQFDVILFLGILYHLDVPDAFHVIENLYDMTRRMVIIDTHICLNPWVEIQHNGHAYKGGRTREHGDDDPDSVRRTRLLSSFDNTLSFLFTKPSLVELLRATGFTSVFECHAPLEALKPKERITLVALKGTPVKISAYPWLNDKTEEEVERTLRTVTAVEAAPGRADHHSMKGWIRAIINRILRPLGCEIIRV